MALRFSSVKVDEIMHRDARLIDPDTSVADAARKMRDMDVGCLPVWEGEKLIGIITDRDVTCRAIAEARDPVATTVRDVMSKDVAFCFEDQTAADAAHVMQENKIGRLPVFDHDNHLVGMLTLGDLAINTPLLTGQIVRAASAHR